MCPNDVLGGKVCFAWSWTEALLFFFLPVLSEMPHNFMPHCVWFSGCCDTQMDYAEPHNQQLQKYKVASGYQIEKHSNFSQKSHSDRFSERCRCRNQDNTAGKITKISICIVQFSFCPREYFSSLFNIKGFKFLLWALVTYIVLHHLSLKLELLSIIKDLFLNPSW